MVSMLQTLQTEDGMRRGAFTIVAECFHMARLMVHCLWDRVMHMCTSGHIISLEFHSLKKLEFICQGIKDIPLWKWLDVVGGVKDNSASLDC